MFHYYMFNKPYGCVTARTDARYTTVMDYFKELENENLSPVGRLDLETEGLLIITDDGKWNQKMTNPKFSKEKVYEFISMGSLTEEKINILENGMKISGMDKLTAPAKVEVIEYSTFEKMGDRVRPEIYEKLKRNLPTQPMTFGRITITEGKKHQVRKMLKAVNCYVVSLKRVAFGGIWLDENLKAGEWKEIEVVKENLL